MMILQWWQQLIVRMMMSQWWQWWQQVIVWLQGKAKRRGRRRDRNLEICTPQCHHTLNRERQDYKHSNINGSRLNISSLYIVTCNRPAAIFRLESTTCCAIAAETFRPAIVSYTRIFLTYTFYIYVLRVINFILIRPCAYKSTQIVNKLK